MTAGHTATEGLGADHEKLFWQTTNMDILIDGRSLQAWQHLDSDYCKGKRLAAFLDIISSLGSTRVKFTEDEFTQRALAKADLLIILTRFPETPLLESEIDAIEEFVQSGGSLLLMSNHAPCPQFDGPLASRFGVALGNTAFTSEEKAVMDQSHLGEHTIIRDGNGSIEYLVTATTCSIRPNGMGEILSYLPDIMRDQDGNPPDRQAFAVALDRGLGPLAERSGRIVVTADSGFIGSWDLGPDRLGAGLIDEGDNRLFVERSLRWLLD